MSKDAATPDLVVKPDPVVPDVKPDPVTGDDKTPQSIPYGVFKETREQLKAAKEALEKFQNDQEAVRKKELEAKEEYKTLYEQEKLARETQEKLAKQWTEYQANRRKALIDTLPEDDRDIYGDLPLDKLEKVATKLNLKPKVPGVDNSLPTGDTMGFNDPMEVYAALKKGEIEKSLAEKLIGIFERKVHRQKPHSG